MILFLWRVWFWLFSVHAARANLLGLKFESLFCCLTVFLVVSNLVNLFLKALVFFILKSRGVLFFLWSTRAWSLLFSLITVKTLAIAFLTTYDNIMRIRGYYSNTGELDLWGGGNLANSQLSQFFLKTVIRGEWKVITLNLVSSSTRDFSSFCLSSWAFTLYIFVNLIY